MYIYRLGLNRVLSLSTCCDQNHIAHRPPMIIIIFKSNLARLVKSNATPPQFNTSKLHQTRKRKQTKHKTCTCQIKLWKNSRADERAITLFLADCNGRVRVCMHIVAMHICQPFHPSGARRSITPHICQKRWPSNSTHLLTQLSPCKHPIPQPPDSQTLRCKIQ